MKNITNYIILLALLFFAACDKSQEGAVYNSNKVDSKEIHFIQASIVKEFAQTATTGKIEVEIARSGNKGDYKVYLSNKGDDASMFVAPQEIVIPDGSYAQTFEVTVNLADFTVGGNYKTTLYISSREVALSENSTEVSQFSDQIALSASFELKWEPYYRTTASGEQVQQLATFYYAQYYQGRDSGLTVEKAVGTDIYRLNDWASGVTFRFIINSDNTCTVPAQSIGYFNSNYNEYVYVSDMAVYTGNSAAYSSYPCTYDGKSKFSFYLIYYVSAGYFVQGIETMEFESDPDTTPLVGISFDGIETTTTGFQAPQLSFSPNSYTKFYKAAVVEGDITTNAEQQASVREQMINGTLTAATPVVTFYESDQSIWNVSKGNYTAVALPYDNDEQPGDLMTERFTYDPDDEYGVKVDLFEWFCTDTNANYSPYTTLFWNMKVRNVAAMQYLCMRSDIVDYLCEYYKMTLQELTAANGTVVPQSAIDEMLSDEGRNSFFNTMVEGTDYTLCILMTNSFGDSSFISKSASTYGRSASDFDRTKSLADYLGAFNASATVSISGGTSSTSSYRIDISRVSDTEVLIQGASDMRDFTPTLKGSYDSDLHMIIVEPQSAGTYDGNYAMFSLTDGMSSYWGANSLAIGYIGDTLYWRASPYSEAKCYGYMFLLFSSPTATSSTYLRQSVGSKTYSNLSMTPLQLAPTATQAQPSVAPILLRAGDREIQLQQVSEATTGTFASQPNTAASYAAPQSVTPRATATKTLRQGLQLHRVQ